MRCTNVVQMPMILRWITGCLVLLIPCFVQAVGTTTPIANPPQPIYVLSQSAIPFIKASSGTMGNNGAVSAMTALPKTYSGGAYLHLPAGAICATCAASVGGGGVGNPSAAGWYWFVGSSTTAGTVYNYTYSSGQPTVGTATALAETGPGAYTGETGSPINGPTFTLPANLMGVNGRFYASIQLTYNNSAGSKAANVLFGGTTCTAVAGTTSTAFMAECQIINRGSASIQSARILYLSNTGVPNNAAVSTDLTINTAANVTIDLAVQTSVATDHIVLDQYTVQVTPMP